MAFEINGKTYETDEEGYLANLSDWNTDAVSYTHLRAHET